MAIRNALKGGTDMTAEEATSADFNDTHNAFFIKAYADNTGGTIAANTAETDLATITILAADFDSGSTSVTAVIACSYEHDKTAEFKLYVDGSAVKTVTLTSNSSTTNEESGGSITWMATGLDLSSTNKIIKVSCSTSGDTNNEAAAFGLTVLAIRNN